MILEIVHTYIFMLNIIETLSFKPLSSASKLGGEHLETTLIRKLSDNGMLIVIFIPAMR